jgi:hypothetical protein
MRRNTRVSRLFYQGIFWLGREDSNLRMGESKSAALPLGYLPQQACLDARTTGISEQFSCSEMTGFHARSERCCADFWGAKVRFWGERPARLFGLAGLRWCGGWRRAHLRGSPMMKPKSKTKVATRLAPRTIRKAKSRPRAASASPRAAPPAETKHARIIAMLRSSAGATIAAMMTATNWQQHSVRSFLAGVVRKKLGLNLISEQNDKGRIYRIKGGKSSGTAADRVKQVA